MNVWGWVHATRRELYAAGEERLATLMGALPTAVCAGDGARVDAIVPEALALARAIEHPWVEVFIRHWDLQSRVLKRLEVKNALPDAVGLLDFAHREETRDCPQSVCAVQDLANCYGLMDGPGFTEERLAVTRETLARIHPGWGCFQCVALEEADALRDAGDPGAALAFSDGKIAEIEAYPGGRVRHLYVSQRVELLAELGRFREGLAYLDASPTEPEEEMEECRDHIVRARLLHGLGRHDEAARALPAVDAVAPFPGLYARWVRVSRWLVEAGVVANDGELGDTVRRFAAQLAERGIARMAIELWLVDADLALARREPALAARAAVAIDALVPRLAKPLDAPEQLAALRARIDAAIPVL
jgi:hypothetical protein